MPTLLFRLNPRWRPGTDSRQKGRHSFLIVDVIRKHLAQPALFPAGFDQQEWNQRQRDDQRRPALPDQSQPGNASMTLL